MGVGWELKSTFSLHVLRPSTNAKYLKSFSRIDWTSGLQFNVRFNFRQCLATHIEFIATACWSELNSLDLAYWFPRVFLLQVEVELPHFIVPKP
jgi:hypothetical protein